MLKFTWPEPVTCLKVLGLTPPQKGYVRLKKEISEEKKHVCKSDKKNFFRRFLLNLGFSMTMIAFYQMLL